MSASVEPSRYDRGRVDVQALKVQPERPRLVEDCVFVCLQYVATFQHIYQKERLCCGTDGSARPVLAKAHLCIVMTCILLKSFSFV